MIRIISNTGKIIPKVSPNTGTTLAYPITLMNEVFLSFIICKKLYPKGVETLEQFLFK